MEGPSKVSRLSATKIAAALLAAGAVVVGASACGSDSPSGGEGSTTSVVKKEAGINYVGDDGLEFHVYNFIRDDVITDIRVCFTRGPDCETLGPNGEWLQRDVVGFDSNYYLDGWIEARDSRFSQPLGRFDFLARSPRRGPPGLELTGSGDPQSFYLLEQGDTTETEIPLADGSAGGIDSLHIAIRREDDTAYDRLTLIVSCPCPRHG